MSVPFLTVRPKAIKLKVIPKLPADLREGVGIDVEKSDSIYTVALDYSGFIPSVVPPNNNQMVALWDQALGTYTLIPAHDLGGDITNDAPPDGFTYGRNMGAWSRALDLALGGIVSGNVSLNGSNTIGGATAFGSTATFNGTATFTAGFSCSGAAAFTNTITVPTPTLAGQAANKSYVDGAVGGAAGTALPLMDGVAAVGVSALYSRQDHVHPTDTSRAPVASPTFTGDPKAPTPAPGDNDTSIATTAFVTLSFAPLNSPALTGTPTAPTAPVNTNTTQIATTAFVVGQAATVAPLMDSAAAVGVSLLYARQDHVHATDTSRAPVNNPTFTGTVNISGALDLSGITSPAAITANQNNYNPTGLAANTILRLTASSAVNITGLAAQSSGSVVALTNIGANAITLTNLDAGSLAANQFNIGANVSLTTGQTALLFYDGVASQWRNLAGSGSGGGGGGAAVYVQDTAPVGATPGSLWWQSSTGQLFLYYSDGTSTQWVFAASAATIGSAVLAKNYVVNGAMMVSQENGTTAGTTNGYYPVDQWFVALSASAGGVSVAQVAVTTPAGSPNRIRMTVTGANAAPAAADFLTLSSRLEGERVADLLLGTSAARTFTVPFGVRLPAGTYGASLRNAGGTRCYVGTFTVAAGEANTDVYKAVTFVGDTTGTWAIDNTCGLQLNICVMAGANWQGTPGAWTASNILGATGQSNLMAVNGQTFDLFDVGLYVGSQPPAFQVPDYSREVIDCKRYWRKSYDYATLPGAVTTNGVSFLYVAGWTAASPTAGGHSASFGASMRAPPTITTYSPATGASGKVRDSANGADVVPNVVNVGAEGFSWYANASANTTALSMQLHFTANARM